MKPIVQYLAFLPCLLFSTACHTTPVSPPPEVRDDQTKTIKGTVRLRDGITLPPNASLRIVVRWYDEIITSQSRPNVDRWPTTFAMRVKWPLGKGWPTTSVDVSAWADINGQPTLLSGAQPCHYDELNHPMDFTLIPVRE